MRKILEYYKETSGDNYDCMVPISGGKDSIFQLHVLTRRYNMRPLAVTFSHNWYSKTGWDNLWNCLEKLDVDHIMFTPRRSLVNELAKRSLFKIGDSCWHCPCRRRRLPLADGDQVRDQAHGLGRIHGGVRELRRPTRSRSNSTKSTT